MRLSEFAGLLWDDIDEEKQIIRIKPNDVKTGVKTGDSYRLVKPFANVWHHIKEWRGDASGSRFAFPRPSNGKTWFTIYKKRARCVALSHYLQDELKRKNYEPNDKVALRLRHWWSTTMHEKGVRPIRVGDGRPFGGHGSRTLSRARASGLIGPNRKRIAKLLSKWNLVVPVSTRIARLQFLERRWR